MSENNFVAPENFVGKKSKFYEKELEPSRVDLLHQSSHSQLENEDILPTVLTICREGEFELMEAIGIPLNRVLHGEQHYEILGSLRVPQTFRYQTEGKECPVKRGSAAMQIFMMESQVWDASTDELLAKATTSFVVRGGGA